MNRRDYITEANLQIANAQFYQKLDRDPTEEHTKLVNDTLDRILDRGDIDERAFYDQRTLKQNLPDDTLLVTMDVVSLYTNIPHADGIAVCRAAWDRRVSMLSSTQSLVDLFTLVLILNNYKFNDDNYLQISGTAMGTKMAPSYANVFMGHLESAILTSAPIKPFSWLRFIDDIEIKWISNRQSLDEFIEHSNTFHNTIRFTADISSDTNMFLDTRSTLVEGTISTDLYSKPTDSHIYLCPTSCHP
ncbi:uncharacterized protein [Argopecten irradians]|uniref:uncharacterized protein n=1 Tax=Argopecten irradians TaxID=31199 RepID=UPI0037197746